MILVTLQELSIENLQQIGGQDFSIMMTPSNPNFRVPVYAYKVSESPEYILFYKVDSRMITLKDGVETNGQGWLIVSKSNNEGVAFWSYAGQFSSMPSSLKQTVVDSFNTLTESQDEESVVSGELGEKFESRNEAGETVEEERARLRQEEAEANGFDSWSSYQNYLREQEDAIERGETTPVMKPEDFANFEGMVRRSENVIREIDEVYSSTQDYLGSDATMSRKVEGRIIEKTEERWSVQINQYEVVKVNYLVTFNPSVSQEFETQVEAEEFFDNYISQSQSEIEELAEDSAQSIAENLTESVTDEVVEVFWKKSDMTFEEAMKGDMTGRGNERPFYARGVYEGGFGDSLIWSKGGNRVELVDFDTPRVTSEGITENLSGGLAFRVAWGWKVKISIKSNSMTFTSQSKSSVEDIEGIEIDGKEFEVTMYGGDILQIDIDNEREGLYPFVVTSAGKKWESIEEIDDEVFITMESLEQLWFRHEKVVKEVFVNPPREGEIKSETSEIDVTERVTFKEGSYLDENLLVNGEVYSQINANPNMKESLEYKREIFLSDVQSESSFYSQQDLGEDITEVVEGATDTVGDVAGGIWDSIKWYIFGGLAVVILVGGVYVFINARAKRGE
jgi:hypothetical protein